MHVQLLQTVNIAEPFSDSKTIVDKPTVKTSNQTLADFNQIAANGTGNITYGQIVNFLNSDFVRPHECQSTSANSAQQGEGQELEATTLPGFVSSPKFLSGVKDPVVGNFSQIGSLSPR